MQEVDWGKLPGRLVVLSGASGSGKSTLVRRLLARPDLRLKASISATTRPPRPGERPGVDYFFLSPAEFEAIRGDLLESALVHGYLYGTPGEPVREALAQGTCVILVIDVQGGLQVRTKVPEALLIFVSVPGLSSAGRPASGPRDRRRGDDPAAACRRGTRNRDGQSI